MTKQRQFTMKIAVLRDKLDTVRGLRPAQFYLATTGTERDTERRRD